MPSVEITTVIPDDAVTADSPITIISQTVSLAGPPGASGGGGGGAVHSVTGTVVDNTDPANPVVNADAAGAASSAQSAAAADATSKVAAEAVLRAAADALLAPLAGAAFTGPVTVQPPTTGSNPATKSYADGLVVGLYDYRGGYDASGNTFPTTGGSGTAGAVVKADTWDITVAGTLGGKAVAVGDTIRALVDTPGQTAGNWNVLEHDLGYAPLNPANNLGDVNSAASSRANLHTPFDSLPASMAAVGRYNPETHVYTPTGGQTLVKLPAKLAQSRKGVGRTKIAFIGASNVAGWNGTSTVRGVSDYPLQVSEMIHAAGWDASEPLFTFNDAVTADTRGTITGTWVYSSHPANAVYVAGSSTATLTCIASRQGDSVEIAVAGTSAAFTILVDGVSITASYPGLTVTNGTFSTVFATPDGGAHITKVVIPGLALAAHTVKISCVGGVIPLWIDVYNSKGVSVANFGSSGTRTADWNDTSLYYTLLNEVIGWGPDTVVLDTGLQFNSWQNSETFPTSLTNLAGIVTTLQGAGIEVFLNGVTPAISPTLGTPTSAFWQNFYTLAEQVGVPYLEQYTAWGSSETVAAANGLIGSDTVHPSASGYSTIAKSIANAWGVSPWKRLLPLKVNDGILSAAPPTYLQPNTMTAVNPTSGTFAVTFPTAPADATLMGLTHVGSNTNTATITAGGSDTITGTASIGKGDSQLWIYFAASTTWIQVANIGIPKASFTAKGGILAGTGVGTFQQHTAGTDGQPIVYDSSQTDGLRAGGAASGWYGDNSDGSVTFDGTTTVLGMVPASSVYTLTRDLNMTNVTLNNNVTLKCNGFRPFVSGVCTGGGSAALIHNNGATATSATAGIGGLTNSIGSNRGDGGNGTTTTGSAAAGQSQAAGGSGGAGGLGSSGAGGAGGAYSLAGAANSGIRSLPGCVTGLPQQSTTPYRAGGGGGGGGGDGTNSGGGGGGGGGPLILPIRLFAGTGAIQSRGGNGFTPTVGNTGGGGGGAGGYISILSASVVAGAISGWTIDCNAGTAGTGHGTGANGVAGGNGNVFLIPN